MEAKRWWEGTQDVSLPSRMVAIDHLNVDVHQDQVRFGSGSDQQEEFQRRTIDGALHIRSENPLDVTAPFFYFEITIDAVSGSNEGGIALGLVHRTTKNSKLPGEEAGTIGWFLSQRMVHKGSSGSEDNSFSHGRNVRSISSGDSVGCFVNMASKTVAFTVNSDQVDTPVSFQELVGATPLYPAVGIQRSCHQVCLSVRFACEATSKLFRFNVNNHVNSHFRSFCDRILLDGKEKRASQARIPNSSNISLVQKFFETRGMGAAAQTFLHECQKRGFVAEGSELESATSLGELEEFSNLRQLILSVGNVSSVIGHLRTYHSDFLRIRQDVLFRLKLQEIVEGSLNDVVNGSHREFLLLECGRLLSLFHQLERKVLCCGRTLSLASVRMTSKASRHAAVESIVSLTHENVENWDSALKALRQQCWIRVLSALESFNDSTDQPPSSVRGLLRRNQFSCQNNRHYALVSNTFANASTPNVKNVNTLSQDRLATVLKCFDTL